MADENAPYTVGFGKPPSERRFQKGRSGNPKGRPKGSKNLATIVLKESRQKVRINSSRGTRAVTKAEATVMQIANKSIQGDLRAARDFIDLIERSEDNAISGIGLCWYWLSKLYSPIDSWILRKVACRTRFKASSQVKCTI